LPSDDDGGRQPQVGYTYDNANRLTQVAQVSQFASLAYDDADRRTSVTYPNTNKVEYLYHVASELTTVTYKKGMATLGTLRYTSVMKFRGCRSRNSLIDPWFFGPRRTVGRRFYRLGCVPSSVTVGTMTTTPSFTSIDAVSPSRNSPRTSNRAIGVSTSC
jgi:YD repeat-containing protein